jgi:undecaprenyl-diphosphatase
MRKRPAFARIARIDDAVGVSARHQTETGTDTSPTVVRRRVDAILVGVGLVVFALCAAVARSGRVGPLERRVFGWANGLPDILTAPMVAVQFVGVLAAGFVVAAIAMAFRRYRLAIAAVIVTVLKLLAERGIWQLVSRSRPGTEIPGAIVRGSTPTSGAAFVSGHVVLVTALAMIVTPYLDRRWRVVPAIVVALVALSRLYLGAHAPLDVLGALGVGAAIGGVVNLALGVPSDDLASEPSPSPDELEDAVPSV